MIQGIGCDLCAIHRMKAFTEAEHRLRGLFTERELSSVRGIEQRRLEHLAGLFAAKEAVSKALGTGFSGFSPTDIEILPDAAGAPRAVLHGGALARLNGAKLHVSISHEGDTAMAFAVMERD